MAVQQARFLSHAFPHDLNAFMSPAPAASQSHFFDHHAGCVPPVNNTVLSDLPRSELTCNDNYGVVPRKRARMMAGDDPAGLADLARQRLVLQQPAQTRAAGSGAPSTSGRMANAAGFNSLMYNQGVEMDALIRLETERMRAGLEEARRRHATAALATLERAAAGRLQAVEAELELARFRNGQLEEKLRRMTAEGQAWLGVAKSHEAVAAGLRATLDQLLQPPCAVAGAVEGGADDAQSCCFETQASDNAADNTASKKMAAAAPPCKVCGQFEACVLLLPCRHLSLCGACEAAVNICPVCSATKNASLHVLFS